MKMSYLKRHHSALPSVGGAGGDLGFTMSGGGTLARLMGNGPLSWG